MLLDAIAEGMSAPDAAQRGFAARCMAEFMKWAIKQSTNAQMANSPIHVDALLRRLFSLIRHPSPYRRAAAATAFNAFYR